MRPRRLPRRTRQAEERTRFVGDILEIGEATTFADDVEQISMLAAGGVELMWNCT